MSTLLRACADHVYKYGLLVTSILGSLAFGLVRSARTQQRRRRNDASNPFGLLLKETTTSQTKLHGISNHARSTSQLYRLTQPKYRMRQLYLIRRQPFLYTLSFPTDLFERKTETRARVDVSSANT